MTLEILMPALSPTMKEGNLVKWLKKEGDKIKAGDVMAEIETDKATMEFEAVDEGVLGKIIINGGTEGVKVNEIIALLLEDGDKIEDLANYKSKKSESAQPQTATSQVKLTTESPIVSKNISDKKIFISPLAKRIAEQSNVNISKISGSGPNGRIVKDDVLNLTGNSQIRGAISRNSQEFTVIKNNNIRKVIAQRLQEAKQTIPHFYVSIEVNMENLLANRKIINSFFENAGKNTKISVNDIIIKAVATAMKDVPQVNSSWSDEGVILYNNIDISVAVSIDDGLITPIIKNSDQKSFSIISAEMKELAKKAKEGKLKPEEFQGGGFTISNLGMFGVDNFNAIINPPQSCILAIGASIEKPVVINGEIKVQNIACITLSSDHRVVDGAVAAKFLQKFKNYVENIILLFKNDL